MARRLETPRQPARGRDRQTRRADRRQRVLIIGSEMAPFAKTGGLADVLGALPHAVVKLGWDVTVALPRYRGVTAGELVERFPITIGSYQADVGFYSAEIASGVRVLFVDCRELFDREALYGLGNEDYADNALRFALLVRAALEFAGRDLQPPSVVHAHDWQAGLAPVYLRTMYASHPTLGGVPSVFTIHNLAYQGLFDAVWLPRLDLPAELFAIERAEYWGRISFLKAAINDAAVITTVSPQYAREIQTPDLGFGFDGILRRRAADLVGILNGIDTDEWNPARDRFLPAPFDSENPDRKADSKRAVLERYGLPVNRDSMERPLIGMISRMVDQKGFDLIVAAGGALTALDASWVILGTGEARYQDFWTDLARRHPDRVGAYIGFDEARAHLIEAGADLFLMPSRFEPCGLNQMYSLHYGTVPVVHGVGGLLDTVRDESPADPDSNGFVFREYSPKALVTALERALGAFQNRARWRALETAGMREDNSWDRSAREYVNIYRRLAAD